MKPHVRCTEKLMKACPVVLCLQDSISLGYNNQDIDGLGPLQNEPELGLLLHPIYVVTPAREPLGLIDSWHWACEPRDANVFDQLRSPRAHTESGATSVKAIDKRDC